MGTQTRPIEDPSSTPLVGTGDGGSLSSPGVSAWSPGEDTLAGSLDEESSDESPFK